MAEQAGNLHWHRRRISLEPGLTDINTWIITNNKGYGPLEPGLGVEAASAPPAGTQPASRVNVIPMPPTSEWVGVSHGEPYVSTIDGYVHVLFDNTNETTVELNVLFWNPHTGVTPGRADTYEPVDPGCEDCTTLSLILQFVNEPETNPAEYSVEVTECALVITARWDPFSVGFAPTIGPFNAAIESAGFTSTLASTTAADQFAQDNWPEDPDDTSIFTTSINCANPAVFDADNFTQTGDGPEHIVTISQAEPVIPHGTLTGTVTAEDTFTCCP
jgi:hypothetical protein